MIPVESNGTTPRQQLRDARVKLRLCETEIRLKHLERTQKLLESNFSNYDWVNAYSALLDRFRNEPGVFSITTAYDRRWGRNFPLFQTEQELALLRMPSRILCGTNSYAIGLLEGLSSYVNGSGFVFRAAASPNKEAPDELIEAVQKVIDRHLERNEWYGAEKPSLENELFWRSCEDGEFILAHHCTDEGYTDLRTIEPEQLTQPPGSDSREWFFGIKTPPDDVQNHLAYWAYWDVDAAHGREYDAKEIVHFRRNVKRSIKRGMPDFSFDTADSLQIASKLRRSIGLGAAVQASIAGIREHQSATQATAQSFVDALANFQVANTTTGQTQNATRYDPGTWVDVPQSMKYLPPPAYTNSQVFVDILHACLRGAGVRWNAPEWLATASGADMAAYTASLTAESPFVRNVIRNQRAYKEAYRRSVQIAVENYIRCRNGLTVLRDHGDGRVGEEFYSWEQVRRLVEIQCEAQSPETHDKLQEAQTLAIERTNGVTSVQTWQQIIGRDTEQEQQNIEEYNDRMGTPGSPLPMPGEEEAGQGAGQEGGGLEELMKGLKRQQESRLRESAEGCPGLVEVPDIRQPDHFSCGACAAMCCGLYYGVGPATLEEWKHALGTDVEESTHPKAIEEYLRSLGLTVTARAGMEVADLANYTRQGMPVIICCQDYGPEVPEEARWAYGHYLTVIGVAMGYIFCQDSSEDNVIADSGSVQKPGRVMISAADFAKLWHDRDVDNVPYVHFGIAVGPPQKTPVMG